MRRMKVTLAAAGATLVLAALPAGSASASLFREVKVTVVNESSGFAGIWLYEAGVSGLRVQWHPKTTSFVLLPRGKRVVVQSGEYGERTLAIADGPKASCHNPEGLIFSNPMLGSPDVAEARDERNSWRIQGPYPRSRSFGVGGTHEFWKDPVRDTRGAVRVTRGPDSRDYIEFTETIYRQQCQ